MIVLFREGSQIPSILPIASLGQNGRHALRPSVWPSGPVDSLCDPVAIMDHLPRGRFPRRCGLHGGGSLPLISGRDKGAKHGSRRGTHHDVPNAVFERGGHRVRVHRDHLGLHCRVALLPASLPRSTSSPLLGAVQSGTTTHLSQRASLVRLGLSCLRSPDMLDMRCLSSNCKRTTSTVLY